MIYLDNAATTLVKPQRVVDALIAAINHMGNAGRGATEEALQASRRIYEAREKLADFFGAENATRIGFTCNSTESLNLAIKGLLKEGDHVITTVMEHNSVLRPLYEMEERGVELSFVRCDEKGRPCYEEFESNIRENTLAIICTHASNLTGNVVDIERIGGLCRERGLLFIVDASQTAGYLPIDVRRMKIDVLCFTGHKSMLGLQGTGGIYVREGVELRALKTGGTGIKTYSRTHPTQMPTVAEAGTLNGHGIVALSEAVSYLNEEGIDRIAGRERELMRRFYDEVSKMEGMKIYGDFETELRCPIVALNFKDYDSAEVSDELMRRYEISTRSGGHCAPLMHRSLGTEEQGAVRFSFSHFNTEEEVDIAVRALKELVDEEERADIASLEKME
ncbi:MAG: aminotransferase class V-fold PLP-dependent enzyme [Filifactor alocis]|nr:aminotransferase class V-fold PLP-dependent enzyme [Filifactor alocis]